MKSLEQLKAELKSKHDVNNNPDVFSPWSFDAAVEALSQGVEAFDESAAEKALADYMNHGDGVNPSFLMRPDHKAYFLARWQHAQSALTVNALKAELQECRAVLSGQAYTDPGDGYHYYKIRESEYDGLKNKLAAKDAEIERLKNPREFPIMRERGAKPHPTTIPWELADLAYSVYSARYRSEQSLKRIAECGGFGPGEMDMFVPDWRDRASKYREMQTTIADQQALLVECLAWFSAPGVTLSAELRAKLKAHLAATSSGDMGAQALTKRDSASVTSGEGEKNEI